MLLKNFTKTKICTKVSRTRIYTAIFGNMKVLAAGSSTHTESGKLEEHVEKGIDFERMKKADNFDQWLQAIVPGLSIDKNLIQNTIASSYAHICVSSSILGEVTLREMVSKGPMVGYYQRVEADLVKSLKGVQNLGCELLLMETLYNLPKIKVSYKGRTAGLSRECTELCADAVKKAITFKLQDFYFDEKKGEYRLQSDKSKKVVVQRPMPFKERYLVCLDIISGNPVRMEYFQNVKASIKWTEQDIENMHRLDTRESQVFAWHLALSAHVREFTKLMGIMRASALTEEDTEGVRISGTLSSILGAENIAKIAPLRYAIRKELSKSIYSMNKEFSLIFEKLNLIVAEPIKNSMAQLLFSARIGKVKEIMIKYMDIENTKFGKFMDYLTGGLLVADIVANAIGVIGMNLGYANQISDFFRSDAYGLFSGVVIALFLSRLPKYLLKFAYRKTARIHMI